jgi:hypothetical protein
MDNLDSVPGDLLIFVKLSFRILLLVTEKFNNLAIDTYGPQSRYNQELRTFAPGCCYQVQT